MIAYGSISPFMHSYRNRTEQKMLEGMQNEVARLFGIPCYYVARNFTGFDQLYGATESDSYTYTWQLAVVQKNVLGFAGDKEFMDKFAGLQIRDQIIFSIPIKTFEQVVAQDPNFPKFPQQFEYVQDTFADGSNPATRPREGDLLYYPFNRKVFKIMYVNKTDMFYQLGRLYVWDVTCELYEYSDEQFDTGIPDLDRIQAKGSTNVLDWCMSDTDGTLLQWVPYNDYWVVDKYARVFPTQDNNVIDAEANNYIDWNNNNLDPFADANNVGPTI